MRVVACYIPNGHRNERKVAHHTDYVDSHKRNVAFNERNVARHE